MVDNFFLIYKTTRLIINYRLYNFYTEVVDFGVLSANNKTVSSRVKVTNKGALDGEFRINYTGDLPITFVPARDVVPAYSHFYIRVISHFLLIKYQFHRLI